MAGKELAFKAEDYDRAVVFYDTTSDAIVKDLMKDRDGNTPRLEDAVIFKPGSGQWDLAQSATTRIKGLAGGFAAQYKTLEKKYGDFAVKLKSARDVFDETDDLATMSAQDFITNYLGEVNAVGRPPKDDKK